MTAPTRELERTRNGAKVMVRTLEAAKVEIAGLRSDLAEAQQDNVSLLHLLALIREACGDSGKRMQDELVEYIRDERHGHISHITLIKASLKQAGQETDAAASRIRALETALQHCLNWLPNDCAAACEAAALLEKS